jgi:esterase/lipase superfamily enzyme
MHAHPLVYSCEPTYMASPTLTLEHHGQPITVSISGKVIDECGEGVQEAGVTVLLGEMALANASSDELGQFSFPNLETKIAIHSLRARRPSYQSADEEVVVTKEFEGRTIDVVLRLHSLSEKPLVERESRPDSYPLDAGETVLSSYLPQLQSYTEVRVFFATDRNKRLDRAKVIPTKTFGDQRNPEGAISFGYCDVSIPAEHHVGRIERPGIFQLYMEDPNKHIVLLRLEKLGENQFFQTVATKASASPTREVFFFIHGYDVTFPEAVRRTAQIAADVNFRGAPICYSWPSAGRYTGYGADAASVEWTVPHLLDVLGKTANLPEIGTIHLIAHSMGNRALVRCMEEIAKGFSPTSRSRFREVVLAAPDVDAGVFVNSADQIVSATKHITMYASSNDLPLKISKQLHDFPRAGESGENIVIVPNIDTIDASAVPSDILGHSYYGSSRTVLSDIYALFDSGKVPPRFGLKEAHHLEKLYWLFIP